jgi:aminotransferase
MIEVLRAAGFDVIVPQGAYYVMTDISGWGYPDDVRFTRYLIEDVGVAAVPGSSFFRDPASGGDLIRFTFCKRLETLDEAGARLRRTRSLAAGAVARASKGPGS